MKKWLIIIFCVMLIVVVSCIAFVMYNKLQAQHKVHYHAGFIVFQDNKKLDFSDTKYMNIPPCTLQKGDTSHEDPQTEKAHLHDNVGDVVHIERSGAVWKDLFTNIKFPMDYSKTTGFINGSKIENYQSQAIKPDDSLVVFIGNNDIAKDLQQAPTKDYIEKIAKKSTACGD